MSEASLASESAARIDRALAGLGAGLGLRYETGFGPIRLDVAAPIHGDTGDGVQIYIGLGQSF